MKAFNGFDEAKKAASYGGEKLPTGAYICKVLNVEYQVGENGNSDLIKVAFDIVEGEYKDFFKTQYENNTAEDKNWKGNVRIYVPKDDGSERDQWAKNRFAKWTNGFEASNKGYVWDWDEKKWKGLLIGIVFGETGTKINGKDIVYTEARFACSVDEVRNDKAPKAKRINKNGYGEDAPANTSGGDANFVDVSATEDLPWLKK